MLSLFQTLYIAIDFYIYVIVAAAIMSWLVAFNVVNTQNRFVAVIYDALTRLTEPALRPIRRILPNLGGIDISPLVLIFALLFLQFVIRNNFLRSGALVGS